jgi:chitinase domain-containing protein 1
MKASNAGSEERSMQLYLVIPPPTDHKKDARSLTRADMTVIENSIDGLSVMTYDFSGPNRPGPNAPAPWIESTLQNLRTAYENSDAAPEVLLGLNFYGNDFTLPQGMLHCHVSFTQSDGFHFLFRTVTTFTIEHLI